jgi:hypothetical protein
VSTHYQHAGALCDTYCAMFASFVYKCCVQTIKWKDTTPIAIDEAGIGFMSEFAGFKLLDTNFSWTMQFLKLVSTRARTVKFKPGLQFARKLSEPVHVWPPRKRPQQDDDATQGAPAPAILDEADIDQGEPDDPDAQPDGDAPDAHDSDEVGANAIPHCSVFEYREPKRPVCVWFDSQHMFLCACVCVCYVVFSRVLFKLI